MNNVQLIGYLGRDPQIRACANGNMLAVLRLATDTYFDRKGNPVKITQWHTVKLWGKEQIMKFCECLIKGSHVLVEGHLLYDSYMDKSGQTRHVTEIKANNLVDLDR